MYASPLKTALDATEPSNLFLQPIKPFGILAGMRETGSTLACFGLGDIHIVSGAEMQSIFPI
jgi:hypothetical protein